MLQRKPLAFSTNTSTCHAVQNASRDLFGEVWPFGSSANGCGEGNSDLAGILRGESFQTLVSVEMEQIPQKS